MDKGFFSREYGGLPMWGWIGIGVAGLIVLSMLRKPHSESTTGAPPPPGTPPAQGKATPYIFMVPQHATAQPDAGDRTLRYPDEPRVPGKGPSGSVMHAYGFEWAPYRVIGIKRGWRSAADTSPAGIAINAYGLKHDDDRNASYFGTLITENNPYLDWSRPLDTGSVVNVPKLRYLPEGAEKTQFNEASPAL